MSKRFVNEIDGHLIGDWVRFYDNRALVIGVIEYLYIETGGFKYASTNIGTVSIDSILESRSPDK